MADFGLHGRRCALPSFHDLFLMTARQMARPRVHGMAELVRGYLRARRKHRPIVPVRLPGKVARAFRAGANLARHGAVGRRTWEGFPANESVDFQLCMCRGERAAELDFVPASGHDDEIN